jgi:iron complex transport system ATP-binding protein
MHSIAIHAQSIRTNLGNTEVLHGIDLSLPSGRWTSIVGPNGAGKSTLLKVLAGLLPHTGTVTLLGHSLAALAGRRRAQQLAWLGQNETTGDDLTVPRKPGTGAIARWAIFPAASASACCWRAHWRCRRRCC